MERPTLNYKFESFNTKSNLNDEEMPKLLDNSSETNDLGLRTKRISFTISRKITNEEYLQATFGAIGLFVLFYVVVIMISCVLCIKDYRMGVVEDQVPIVATIEVSENESQEVVSSTFQSLNILHSSQFIVSSEKSNFAMSLNFELFF